MIRNAKDPEHVTDWKYVPALGAYYASTEDGRIEGCPANADGSRGSDDEIFEVDRAARMEILAKLFPGI